MPRRETEEVEWERAAAAAGTGIPPAAPSVTAILEHLPALPAGSVVLDLACGIGQPSFVLAQEYPELEVLGVDVTAALINQARAIAARNAVRNVRFEVMSADKLDLGDASVHAAVSHFGLLQEGDVGASARELARVLTPGAPYSVAAFDDMALNPLMSTIARVLAGQVPAATLPDFRYLTRLAAPGLRERLLRESGLEQLHTEMFRWSALLPSFDAVWGIATGPVPFAPAFGSLDSDGVSRVRAELEQAVAQYRTGDGAFVFPMACRLFWGRR